MTFSDRYFNRCFMDGIGGIYGIYGAGTTDGAQPLLHLLCLLIRLVAKIRVFPVDRADGLLYLIIKQLISRHEHFGPGGQT